MKSISAPEPALPETATLVRIEPSTGLTHGSQIIPSERPGRNPPKRPSCLGFARAEKFPKILNVFKSKSSEMPIVTRSASTKR